MEKKKIKHQHFIQDIENPAPGLLEYDRYELTEILFEDGSTELWVILDDIYDNDKAKATVFYRGWDTIGIYYYDKCYIETKHFRR